MIGEAALQEARLWIGTPYVHQASCRGAGTDCLGLIRGVWRALYGQEPEVPPAYSRDWSEAGASEALWQAAQRHLRAKESAAPGDVILFRMREGAVAKHLGIQGQIGPEASFVHGFSGHGVMESPLSLPWARRIVARFEFPERI